ncbi:DNA polymerase III subunit delta' [Anaerobacillus isosaccharinicus]|uniref:DNA polymerase III subunit delta n=1 Tax=Anaerobacillus isosaccharinicus TaxID=1532552 RepID=A0A7S7LCA0_9BACI|nr:DNA polymerase III subunit delta' [Anaerobacillus isosaccharinicus]MBA5588266.1 DNA polymerase III subunit delta' [Anaerobacillus isosaccharinicus]QOY38292.1 DNA polymerase III subunit delta' [Anaerobacillus isosaccharinicus]
MIASQPKVTKLLVNSIQRHRVAHAYLFEGGNGVGKREVSIRFAKSLLCEATTEPCGECHHCKRIDSRNHPSLYRIRPDGQSIKVDQIRELQKHIQVKSMEGSKRIYIIEHADKMNVQAANSLLKFLEEPKGEVVALLLTERPNKILPTI